MMDEPIIATTQNPPPSFPKDSWLHFVEGLYDLPDFAFFIGVQFMALTA